MRWIVARSVTLFISLQDQQRLRQFVAEHFHGALFRPRETCIERLHHNREILGRLLRVTRAEVPRVRTGVTVVRVIDRHRRDAVTAHGEKLLDGPGRVAASRRQERVAKPHQRFVARPEQGTRDHLALEDVVRVLPECEILQARMRVGVVAQVQSRVEPFLEHRDARVALAGNVELPFVHEHDRRHPLRDEALAQALRDPEERHQVVAGTSGRPVVNGDRHLAQARLCGRRG
jgi:hypothetical protein